MARILYGIQSDGMGHALRSKPVIDHLINKGHNVKIISADRALTFLRKHYDDVEEISRLNFFYYNNRVSYFITILQAICRLDKIIGKGIIKVKQIITRFKPDLIITDFEAYCSLAAKLSGIPLISIDNITVIKLCNVPYSLKNFSYYIAAKLFIDSIIHSCQYYFVTTFFKLPLKYKRHNGRVIFVPPVLRDAIIKAKDKYPEKNHILVYQTTNTNKRLVPALNACKDEKFIFYGCDENKVKSNVKFKKFSEKYFIRDLASAKAVITNGGFTLMSETIYLHKPVLSNPIVGQYEQNLNATLLEKLGYGKKISEIDPDKIRSFLCSLKEYKKNLRKFKQEGNTVLFKSIDQKITAILNKNKFKSVK